MTSITPQLTYYDIDSNITAFSSTRHGGCSKGNYASFNINKYCGDDVLDVEVNTMSLCRLLKVEDVIVPHQVHGTVCKVIDEEFLSLSKKDKIQFLDGVDALITTKRNICIAVSTADCVPVLLFDPVMKVAAVIHAGWRGTQKRIVASVVETLVNKFGVEPSSLKAVIGPSIGLDSFEVGDEVYDCFSDAGFPMDDIACKYGNKWHIDLWEANCLQLINAHLQNKNIQVSGVCTYQHSDLYFSARKLTVNSGRIASGIVIR